MKKLWFFFITVISLAAMAASSEEGLLFHSSFNKFTTTPDYQTNPEDKVSGIPRELQMRMFSDVAGKEAGVNNSVCLNNTEFIGYPIYRNFNPSRGTVSLWVRPINWKMNDSQYYQVFFEVRFNDYRFLIYKQPVSNLVTFYLVSKDKEYHINAPVDWRPDEWHKLDAVWNSSGMKLYIDGKPGELAFKEDPELPPESRWGEIWINSLRGWGVNPEWKTAYDEIKVYDRCLSPVEILSAYEKVVPLSSETAKPLVTFPDTGKGIRCDGKLDTAEWAGSAEVPIISPMPDNRHNENYFSSVKIKHDNNNLYLGFITPRPGNKYNISTRDGELWLDDAVEFHLIGTDGRQRQFIVNPAGTLYDSLEGDPRWNSSARAAASRNGGDWTAELSIPWQDLGGYGEIQANFCNSGADAQNMSYSWSTISGLENGFAAKQFFGTLKPGTVAQAAGIASLGNLQAGKLRISVTGPQDAHFEATVSSMSGAGIAERIPVGKEWNFTLPTGRATLALKSGDAFFYPLTFIVNPPLIVRPTAYPAENRLEVRLDYSAAQFPKGTVEGRVSFKDKKSGEVCAQKDFSTAAAEYQLDLPLSDTLPANTLYTIVSEITAPVPLSIDRDFFIPDMTPYKNRVAIDHTVPPPWVPVKVTGQTVSVLDRDYIFGQGPIPRQIISRGDELLKTQPQFKINTRPITWENVVIGKNHGDYVEVNAAGSFAGGKAAAAGELWFDGMYKWTLSLTPDSPLKLDSLTLDWSVPRQFARYAMSTAYTPWQNDEIRLKWDPREYHSLLWLSGVKTGLAWWCQSDANWIIDPNRPNIIIKRDQDTARININILAQPAELKQPASYTMVFQGTPPRRVNHDFREINAGAHWQRDVSLIIINGFGHSKLKAPDNIRGWTSLVPVNADSFRARVREHLQKNMQSIVYGMPTHMSRFDPEYDYFFKTWSMHPAVTWEAATETVGENYVVEPCCAHTGAGDLFASRIDNLLREQPELYGIYFDIMHIKNCNNPLHGCGGVDAFGKQYSTSVALHLREFTLRVYKLVSKYNRYYAVHAHNAFFPFVHDFCHSWWPGEELYSTVLKNPEWAYLEDIPSEAYQSAWNNNVRGAEIRVMSELERIPRTLRWTEEQSAQMRSHEYAIHALAPSVLYDFQVTSFATEEPDHPIFKYWKIRRDIRLAKAIFHGYWISDAVNSGSPAVKTSWYEWRQPAPYARLLGVVNTDRAPQKAALKINWQKLGLDPEKVSFTELWSGREIPLKELPETVIPGHNFLLLGVKNK